MRNRVQRAAEFARLHWGRLLVGLGLFLVRLVAERCGARFSLHSKLGEGTRCVLELREGGGKNVAPDRTGEMVAARD